jgi:2-amino-4-hydroxy-6-hydroxymethyldihydropteridine diphosphokinase
MRVFIGLGSNLLQPVDQVRRACDALALLEDTRLVAVSALFASAPVGPGDQPDYINAVAELETGLSPLTLLAQLQAIEHAHGRERGQIRWSARTLDLDILLYGDMVINLPSLQVPHPRMMQRKFVLEPLADLYPDMLFPNGTPMNQALADCPPHPIRRLG